MLKRYFLFLLILCCSNHIYSQDAVKILLPDQVAPSTEPKLKPPYFSIYSVFGGISTLPNSGAPRHSTPNTWLIFDGYIPVGHDKLYIYTQFRTSFYMGESSFPVSAILPIMHMENTKLGMLIGLGGIIKDWRIDDVGWHFRVNGGFVLEGGVSNNFIELDFDMMEVLADRFINIGLEANTIFYYNIKKHFAVNIGFHLGYQYSPYNGDSFYYGSQRTYVPFHYMTYGGSFGLSF